MPNQYNYRSDVITPTDARILASRVVKFPEEGILLQSVPSSFGLSPYDNVELHFYTVPGNQLLLSTMIRLEDSDILKSHIVSYEDGSVKHYIRIDFTKLFDSKDLILVPGEYKMVINWFADEIGSYDDKSLYIQQISPTRTEVQLAFINNTTPTTRHKHEKELYEFVEKSFDKITAIGVAEKIFKSGLDTGDSTEGLTYGGILQHIDIPSLGQTFDNTISKIRSYDVGGEEQFIVAVENFLIELYESIREEIIINGEQRIQADEFKEFVSNAINKNMDKLRSSVDRRITIT